MNRKLAFSLVMIILATANGFCQTKKIALHSHSGKDADFSMEVADNFGLDPRMERMMDSTRTARSRQDSIKIAAYRDSLKKAHAPAKKRRITGKQIHQTSE